jgi:hypothetical protein
MWRAAYIPAQLGFSWPNNIFTHFLEKDLILRLTPLLYEAIFPEPCQVYDYRTISGARISFAPAQTAPIFR